MSVKKQEHKHVRGENVTVQQVMRAFWCGARLFKTSLFITIIGTISVQVLAIFSPIYYKLFFDTVSLTSPVSERASILFQLIAIIGVINIGEWILFRVAAFAHLHFQAKVMAKLRQQAFEYMIDHSYAFYTNNFTGSLVQRVNRFARAFERLTDRLNFTLLPLGIRLIGTAVVLWFINKYIAIALLVFAAVFIIFNYFFSVWKLKYDVERASMDSFTTGVLSDALANQNTIQLFTGSKSEGAYFREVTEDQARMTRFVWRLDAIVEAGQSAIVFLVEFLLFYYAIKYWEMGLVTIGTFALIQIYFLGLANRLWDFSRVVRDVYESVADAKEMVEILEEPHAVKDVVHAKELSVPHGEVRFNNVNFGFSDSRQVLHDLKIHIKSGEKVALIGPSGAGKSTFVKLLFRMFDVTSGTIAIDGADISKVTQESLRRNVSLVPQDPILFHRSLLENIRYGRRDASDAEVIEAARLAHCDEFTLSLPNKYDTFVGERGVKLSGGERQRVAIARAILKDAPILVLDEATSSLDSHSEALIQDALDKLMKGKTTIVIAHRLSTIRKMDRIIVLEKGHVIEEGSHDDLLQNEKSLYTRLWHLQAGGFITEDETLTESLEEDTTLGVK